MRKSMRVPQTRKKAREKKEKWVDPESFKAAREALLEVEEAKFQFLEQANPMLYRVLAYGFAVQGHIHKSDKEIFRELKKEMGINLSQKGLCERKALALCFMGVYDADYPERIKKSSNELKAHWQIWKEERMKAVGIPTFFVKFVPFLYEQVQERQEVGRGENGKVTFHHRPLDIVKDYVEGMGASNVNQKDLADLWQNFLAHADDVIAYSRHGNTADYFLESPAGMTIEAVDNTARVIRFIQDYKLTELKPLVPPPTPPSETPKPSEPPAPEPEPAEAGLPEVLSIEQIIERREQETAWAKARLAELEPEISALEKSLEQKNKEKNLCLTLIQHNQEWLSGLD